MKQENSWRISSILLFIFVTLWSLILIFYHLKGTVHLKHSLSYAVVLALFLCMSAFVYAAGFFICKTLKLECSTRIEETVHCFALGIGFWAVLVLAVGSLGFLYKTVF